MEDLWVICLQHLFTTVVRASGPKNVPGNCFYLCSAKLNFNWYGRSCTNKTQVCCHAQSNTL